MLKRIRTGKKIAQEIFLKHILDGEEIIGRGFTNMFAEEEEIKKKFLSLEIQRTRY